MYIHLCINMVIEHGYLQTVQRLQAVLTIYYKIKVNKQFEYSCDPKLSDKLVCARANSADNQTATAAIRSDQVYTGCQLICIFLNPLLLW